jgi:hypothetical protein
MAAFTAVREGMTAYSADGKKLGKVIRRFSDTLVIEKGLFFRKDYVVGPEDVVRVEGDEIALRLTQEQLEHAEVADQQADREEEDEEVLRTGTGRTEGQPSDQVLAAGDDEPEAVFFQVEEKVVVLAPDDDDDQNRRR